MTSLSRQQIKNIARLKQKKYRILEQRLLIEGARFVVEALRSDWPVEMLIHTHSFNEHSLASQIDKLAARRNISRRAVTAADFNKIAETSSSQGIIALVHQQNMREADAERFIRQPAFFILALEALTDPGNLGTLIRTAAWFGLDAIITGPDCVSWHNSKTLRASMGAIFHLPVIELPDLGRFLRQSQAAGAGIFCADQQGERHYASINVPSKRILVLGNETGGLSEGLRSLADARLVIPRRGAGESLNAAIAAAILIAEFSKSAESKIHE